MVDLRLRKTTTLHDKYHLDAAWRAMADMFRRMDSILAGETVGIVISGAKKSSVPASTLDSTITFYPPSLGDPRVNEDLLALFGANYHELAHVLLTPRADKNGPISRLYDNIRRIQNGWLAWNILEDQRIETALVAMYPAIRPYLVTMFAKYILDNPDPKAKETAWLLGYGRNYLGRRIIDALESVFVGNSAVKATASKLIDRYKALDPVDDTWETLSVVRWFADVITQLQPPPMKHAHPADDGTGNPQNGGGQQGQSSEQQRQQHQQKAQDTPQPSPDDYDAQDDAADQSSGQGQDKPDQGDDQSQDGTGNGPESDSDGPDGKTGSDDQGDGSGDGTNGPDTPGNQPGEGPDDDGTGGNEPHAGAGDGTPDPSDKGQSSTADLDEAMQKAMDRAAGSDQVATDMATAKHRMSHAPISTPTPPRWESHQSTQERFSPITRGFARELERVAADEDPGWSREHPSGRISVKRYMTRGFDPDTAFDQWDPGRQQAASIEVVVGLDHSDSMGSRTALLGPAAWIIKRACDSIHMPCTVFSYATETRTVYQANEKASPTQMPSMRSKGGTRVVDVLLEAHQIFAKSDRTYKALIMMTDGEWFDTPAVLAPFGFRNNDAIIQDMNARGVLTSMFYLGYMDQEAHAALPIKTQDEYWHYTQVRSASQDLMQLPRFARRIITGVMKGAR